MAFWNIFITIACFLSDRTAGSIRKPFYYNSFNPHTLAQVYYDRRETCTVANAVEFENLLDSIGIPVMLSVVYLTGRTDYVLKSYGQILLEMIEVNQFDAFRSLYQLLDLTDPEEEDYDFCLMVDCVRQERWNFLEFMVEQRFDAERFSKAIVRLIEDLARPEWGVELVIWMAKRNERVAERQMDIYSDAIIALLKNNRIDEEEVTELVEMLVRLGAVVSDEIHEVFTEKFPDNAPLNDALLKAIIPTIKEPSAF